MENKFTRSRRSFLQAGSLLALGAAALPFSDIAKDKRHIGVQLWSVREDMKKDAVGTIEGLAKMGFREVEGFGFAEGKYFGLAPKEFKKLLKNNGIKMPSTHTAVDISAYDKTTKQMSDGFKKVVEVSNLMGQKYVVNPWMNEDERKTPDSIKGVVERLNKAGEYCNAHGLRFGYHNHDFEFQKVGGEMIYETLLKNTDPALVCFEMDIYWVHHGKQSPLDWIARYPGRFELCHAKDMAKTPKLETCEVGEGSIDFQEVFDKQAVAGLKYVIVELEDYKRTAMEGVGVSLQNLKKLKFS